MGLSQEEFSRKVGLNRGNIASYEKQTAEPSMMNLSKISKYLSIDLGELIEKDLSAKDELIRKIEHQGELTHDDGINVEVALKESIVDHQISVEKLRKRSDEMARILEGFKQFHKFRMENSNGLSEDVKKIAMDYEKLLEVLEDVLATNKHMMEIIDKNGKG
jgi:transcriptional regulator with XRE-family HTH domain